MLYEDARVEIVQTGIRLEKEGLLSSTAGNISCRVADELIAITPSAIPYPDIQPEDVVITDLDGNVVDGKRRPSSELPFHTAVYRARPDIGGVVHTHSPYATVMAIMRRPILAVHYVIAALGVSEIPVVDYATYGSDELAANIEAVIKTGANGALLANHGAVAAAGDLKGAATNAGLLEFLATAYYRVVVAGVGVVLPADEIATVIERYKAHGQPRPENTAATGQPAKAETTRKS
jgi:L-fuculose-phosphate aldolase